MRRLLWLALLLLASLSIGIGILHGQTVTGGTIDGRVYYTEAGKHGGRLQLPIRGAHISIAGLPAHADSDSMGHFHLASLPAGKYTLTIFHPHFRDPFTTLVTVLAGATVMVAAELGQGYCVAVGVASYRDPEIPALVGPAYDVKSIDRVLFHQFQGHATLLINRKATKARIKAAIRSAAARMSPRDFFIFYFSGHGGSDRLRRNGPWLNYLLPYDSHSDSYAHDISERELADWLKALPDPHKAMLILDSCDSGAFLGSLPRRACLSKAALTSSLTSLKALGCTVLAASGCHENSVDEDDGSLFTDKLIDGLEHRRATIDFDHQHVITLKELFRYAAARTTAVAKGYDEQQHPQLLAQDDPVLLRY